MLRKSGSFCSRFGRFRRFPGPRRPGGAICAAFLAAVATGVSGCASIPVGATDEDMARFSPGRWLKLRTNVHPDGRGVVSAYNYQPQKMIPRCTEVLVTSLDGETMGFRTTDGSEYVWRFEEGIREPPLRHLARFFSPDCDEDRQYTEADEKGIRTGKVAKGMTKWGVYYAMGYPPDDLTPDGNADVWTYWKYKGVKMTVRFENGVVAGIGNPR